MRGTMARVAAVAAVWLGMPGLAVAQPRTAPAARPESLTVAASTKYGASGLWRWLVGNTYRELWATPTRVPVLDLRTYAGGLTLTKDGGGQQTRSLRFEAADGTEYSFRLSDKVMTAVPPVFQGTRVVPILQDQVSAMHPAGAVIAAPILRASGVMHPTAVHMVLPDDSALGEFRVEFAGRLGMLEEFPSMPKNAPGFGNATAIIDSDSLLLRINGDGRERVNAHTYLTARLTDFLINDNDRHGGNWKWARLRDDPHALWEPIARDRDHAFVAFDGVVMRMTRLWSPLLPAFGPTPHVPSLTKPRLIDARLLAGLERHAWDSVATALQARITDSVIAVASRAMPLEYQASAPRLAAVLRTRRDGITAASRQFYSLLAERVEVHGTDVADRARITRDRDGAVLVQLESHNVTTFLRRFDPTETSEIVVYLHGGDDSVLVAGVASRSVTVRVVGGNGTNVMLDSSTVGGRTHTTHLYDVGRVTDVSYHKDKAFDRRPWERLDGVSVPPGRDDGTSIAPRVGWSHARGLGATPRFGFARYGYGFGQRPYASMIAIEGEYALAFQGGRITATVDRRREASRIHTTAVAQMSSIEMISYRGLGNATDDAGSTEGRVEVRQQQWSARPSIGMAFGTRADIAFGPLLQHAVTDLARSPYLARVRPYGIGHFTQLGAQLSARYASRHIPDSANIAAPRFRLEFEAKYLPALFDVTSAYAVASIRAGTSLTLPVPTHPRLVVRVGGALAGGDFPYFEAATIGGFTTTRYMDTQRYAGDASLYGTSELRIPVADFNMLMPLRFGVLGLAEAGRVYVNGRSPGSWHAQTGAGIWLGRGIASSVVTLAYTTERGRSSVGLRLGLNF